MKPQKKQKTQKTNPTNHLGTQASPEEQAPAESCTHTSAYGWRETSRLGKIARLPRAIRGQLNERLADNEPAETLLPWLNELPAVKNVLKYQFDDRPITKQNLSAWKQGGFRDWERAQEARARVCALLEEADGVNEETAEDEEGFAAVSLLDRVGDWMALSLLELFREVELSEKGPRRTREMIEIARELARLRKAQHQQQRVEILQERWEQEKDELEQQWIAEEEVEKEEFAETVGQVEKNEELQLRAYATVFRGDYLQEMAAGTLTPESEARYRRIFEKLGPQLAALGIPRLPEGEELQRALNSLSAHSPRPRRSAKSPAKQPAKKKAKS